MMKTAKIPHTDSIEELAHTHDLTDFEEELEEVDEKIFERRSETVVSLHLRPQEAEAVRRVAKARGVEEAALLREWVLEKLEAGA